MIHKIKKDFAYTSFMDEFQSSDYYKFFGYSRHSSFKRFLDQETFYPYIWCDSFSKINTRKRQTISFDRKLFIELCYKKNKITKEIEDIIVDYYSSDFINRIDTFKIRTKSDIGSSLKMYNVPCGKYYTYSLNTYNLSNDLLICPYEVFKFLDKENYSCSYVKTGFIKESNNCNVPYFSFDHINFNQRHEFLAVIEFIIKNFELSHISKRLADLYYKQIKKMLLEQIKIDHLKKEKYENKKRQKEKELFTPSAEIKDMYRKACKLYHPDKNPNGEEIFKIINNAYKESNIKILKKYSTIM